jgi:hypothetical protein
MVAATVISILQPWDAMARHGRGASSAGSGGGGTAPLVLYTDIISGSATNGESGAGSYLSIFGLNFGTFSNLGTSSGAKVYIGGAEVANYRVLDASVVSALRPGFPAIQRIIVQIGSTAVQALTAGSTYAVSVVVNGVASNANDIRGNPLQFTIQPGHFWFVDTVSGNDATGVKDDITHPFRYIQNFGGGTTGATTGIWLNGNLAAGDTLIIRGNGGTPISDQVGYEGRLMRWSNRNLTSGTTPTGASGHGYVHFTAYPGSALGNACEDVYILNPAGGIGGFMGAGTAYARPNGSAGSYWSCSNMRSDCTGSPGSTDASSFNLQNSADYTRFVNLDIQWNSTSTGAAHQKAGGWVGNGDPTCLLGSYVHNIAGGDSSSLENHGIYMDGSNTCAHNVEVGYCVVVNCTTGQCIQFHNQVATDQFHDVWVHHFWTENSAKYNLKLDSAGANINWWNGVANYSTREGFEFDSTGGAGSGTAVNVENVTFIDNYHDTAGYTSVIANEGSNLAAGGYVNFNNCILVQLSGRTNTSIGWIGGQTGIFASGNLYYDYAGVLTTKYSGDTAGVYASPVLVSAVGYPSTNPQLQGTSNALNRAVSATINPVNDLAINPQPRSGETLRSVGAFA